MKNQGIKVNHHNIPTTALEAWKNPLLPIFYTLKILGRFPFEKDKSGGLGFRLFSAPSVWALVATSLQVAVVVKIYIWKCTNSRNWQSFNVTIASLQEIMILNTSFHACATWLDTPAITRAYNRWLLFHKKFHATIGRKIVSPILNHSYWGIIGSFLFALAVFIEYIFNEKVIVHIFGIRLLKEAVYSTCIFYYTVIIWSWVVYCLTVKKAAEILKDHTSQTLSRRLTLEELAELRSLWVELHACTIEMCDAIGKTVLLTQTLSFLLTLFSLYAGLIYVLVDNSLQVGYAPQALLHSHISSFLVYNLGHFAQQSMTESILILLYSKRWQNFSSPIRVELDLLLDAIEISSPCFEVKGQITLNRRGYVEVLNRIFTYLVILMQIKVSADGAN